MRLSRLAPEQCAEPARHQEVEVERAAQDLNNLGFEDDQD
jgi:hypothetical protein